MKRGAPRHKLAWPIDAWCGWLAAAIHLREAARGMGLPDDYASTLMLTCMQASEHGPIKLSDALGRPIDIGDPQAALLEKLIGPVLGELLKPVRVAEFLPPHPELRVTNDKETP
jgi:hypothetical protein